MLKFRSSIVVTATLVLLLVPLFLNAQSPPSNPPAVRGSISGFVIESQKQKPVEYANVVLYESDQLEQVTGTVTDADGYFQLTGLHPGSYILEVKFIGFEIFAIDSLRIERGRSDINLGGVVITPDVLALSSVEVLGEKPIIEFQIDKKVINVSQQFTALSGTAVDVLENVPSVNVDIEGNVSLRGSGSFTLLVDGRPSVLEANDALQMIPASSIENIEIVTNPSAKFDPDGVAGIINIITKKNKENGITGLVNSSAGRFGNYGADFLLNFHRKNVNFYIGADYSQRNRPGSMTMQKRIYYPDTTSYNYTHGDSRWGRHSYGLRGGLDLDLTPSDLLRIGFQYGGRGGGRESEMDYRLWTVPGPDTLYYTSENSGDRSGGFYSLNLDYTHKFPKEGHQISVRVDAGQRDMSEESVSEEFDDNSVILFGQRSTEAGPGKRVRYHLDYTLPLRGENRIEAGYQGRYSLSVDENTMRFWNADSNAYVFDELYDRETDYARDIQSTYLIYAAESGNFGYQVGVRGEYTYQNIEMSGLNSPFHLDEWNFFPTLHSSYQFANGQQLMASYTRRIDRVRGWYLEPFLTWMDAYNVRRGNPDLDPEYIDSYEAGYQKTFGKSLFSMEAYYRITHQKIERVRSLWTEGEEIFLHSYANVGEDYAFGTEMMLTLFPFRWWNLNLMANIYDYRVRGELYGESFDEGSFNWGLRMNHTFTLRKSTRIQLNANYRSPSVTAQGTHGGMFYTNLAIRQDFLDRALSATLQIRDVLGTASRSHKTRGPGFYSYMEFERQPRMLSLTLTYNINNYKIEREGRSENSSDFEEDGGGFE